MDDGGGLVTYLTDKRGWSLRQPVSENAVLLLTGGIDSSILADLCLSNLHTTIYPLYIRRGAQAERFEEKAAKNIVGYLQKKHGKVMSDLFIAEADIPPRSFKDQFAKTYVLELGYPLRNTMLALYAVQYAVSLSHQGIPIWTVMAGAEYLEQGSMPDCRQLSFLAVTVSVCSGLDDWGWQVVSPYLVGGLVAGRDRLTKEDIVVWGAENGFPFRLTRSCISGSTEPCGVCKHCGVRKKLLANVKEGL